MNVLLTANVYIRLSPDTKSPPLGYYPSGTTISVINQIQGQAIEGFSTWYQIDTSKYIWAGGTDTAQAANNYRINPNQWHLLQYNIPQLWQQYGCRGEGIKIGVVDTGITNNYTDYFGQNRVIPICFSDSTNTDDKIGHGSHCAGIIGANGSKDNLYGVAPACTMYIGKIYDDTNDTQDSYFQKAMIAFSTGPNKVDIISISQGVPTDPSNFYSPIIKSATAKNDIIIVASAGDNPGITWNNLFYPAAIPPTISVGSVDFNNATQNLTVMSNGVTIYAPGIAIYSMGITAFNPTESGTSQATPFIVGVLALGLQIIKSNTNSKFKISDLPGILISSANQITDISQPGKLIKIINPTHFLNTLKSN